MAVNPRVQPLTFRRRRHLGAAILAIAALMTVVLTHLPARERQVGFVCDRKSCWTVAIPQDSEGGPFIKGEIDLTGDGVPEGVQLAGNKISVIEEGVGIWRSDPTWRVVDIALGDPNNDGRYEILAALWKPNEAGKLVCHPYILAHRGGAMKLIWGGSAVINPIYELELADVDDDGVQEIVVLEAARTTKSSNALPRTLSVWDWHGWGFNLRWRSEVGSYRNLGIISQESGDMIVVHRTITYR